MFGIETLLFSKCVTLCEPPQTFLLLKILVVVFSNHHDDVHGCGVVKRVWGEERIREKRDEKSITNEESILVPRVKSEGSAMLAKYKFFFQN